MKTSILALVMLLLSLPLAAQDTDLTQNSCRKKAKKQVVTVIPKSAQQKQYEIKNKKNFRYCNVANNGGNGEMVWQFDPRITLCKTQEGSCQVLLNDASATAQKNVICGQDPTDQFYKCTLKVNKLKDHCDAVDGDDPNDTLCLLDYTIFIGQQEIDPTILITPRPSEN